MLDSRLIEPALSESDILLRDHFVAQYLVDHDAYKACLRIGFLATFALEWAKKLFNDGYVQRKLAYMLKAPVVSAEQEASDRALVENTLREVMRSGSGSERSSAAHKFMVLKGWDKANGPGGENEDLAEQFRRLAVELPA